MPKDIILKKQEYYSNLINSLLATDLEAEVEKRLQPIRAKIVEEINNEIKSDIAKCNNYLELLGTLLDEIEQINIVENETVEDTFTDSITSDPNIEV